MRLHREVKNHSLEQHHYLNRLAVASAVVFVCLGILLARFLYLQIIRYDYFQTLAENNRISLKSFVNKVIFYLWNDVFKDENSILFKGLAYEKFFPVDDNGKEAVLKILNTLDVTINKK